MSESSSVSGGGGMGYAGAATSTYGAVSSAIASKNKAIADQQAYEYQAQVQRDNAAVADMQAESIISAGAGQEQASRLKTAAFEGSQRAALAANGIDPGSTSAISILAGTDLMGERDALIIRDNAAQQAWGVKQQAAGYRADAGLLDTRSDSINPGGAFTTSLISGAGSVASSWYKYRNAGVGYNPYATS